MGYRTCEPSDDESQPRSLRRTAVVAIAIIVSREAVAGHDPQPLGQIALMLAATFPEIMLYLTHEAPRMDMDSTE